MKGLFLIWCECADCKGPEERGSAAEKEQCLRTRFLHDHPDALHKFTSDLLPLLLQVYGSTVLEKVRSLGAWDVLLYSVRVVAL